MQRHKPAGRNGVVRQQVCGILRVLSSNLVHRHQHVQRAQADVSQVPNWSGNHIQRTLYLLFLPAMHWPPLSVSVIRHPNYTRASGRTHMQHLHRGLFDQSFYLNN